jgi:hypothetical protein
MQSRWWQFKSQVFRRVDWALYAGTQGLNRELVAHTSYIWKTPTFAIDSWDLGLHSIEHKDN